MAREVRERVVVAKRGCTCCGTGCVLIGLVLPATTFALWSAVGAGGAVVIVAATMLARGSQVALARRRGVSQLDSPALDFRPKTIGRLDEQTGHYSGAVCHTSRARHLRKSEATGVPPERDPVST